MTLNELNAPLPKTSNKRPYLSLTWLVILWTLVIGGLGGLHFSRLHETFLKIARTAADFSLRKDMIYRQWAALHGGVYVPVSESSPPSPYLSHIPEREVVTPSGRVLTLLNPAYMTRQVYELSTSPAEVAGHITSLTLLRPQNSPDAWEVEALQAFERGVGEWVAIVNKDGEPHLRLMRPFYVEESCLKCHQAQDYAVGDVRGGICVSIPWTPYRQALMATWINSGYGYGGIWVLGLLFMWLHRRRLSDYLRQRLHTETMLAQSQEHFRAIFNGVNDAIILLDAENGKILDFNTRAEDLLGFERDDDRWPSLSDFMSFSRAQAEMWVMQTRQDRPVTFERQMRNCAGDRFWADVTLRKANLLGRPTLLATVRNIEERKRSEIMATELLQRLQKLASHLPGMIYQYRLYPDGRSFFPYSSEGIRKIYGVHPEAVKTDASPVFAVLHPDDLQSVSAKIQQSAAGLSVWHDQYRVNHPEGHLLWVEGFATPERLADGSILWHGYIHDITQKKQAEMLLESSEARYQLLFEHLLEGFALHEILYDENGDPGDFRLVAVNPAFERITGMCGTRLIGKSAKEILHSDDEIFKHFDRVAASGTSEVFEVFSASFGKHFSVSIFMPAPGQLAVTFTDISERKTAEDELRRINDELERFINAASHDLKSPLVTISTFLGYLEQDLENGNQQRVEKDLAFMRQAANKMQRLIGELLEISRVGLVVNQPTEVYFHELARESFGTVAGLIAERGVQISIHGADIILRGDRLRLAAIWQNLVENAVKYMGEQEAPSIEVGCDAVNSSPVFYVRDNGAGIDPCHHETIFGLFEKIDACSEGTGLGLAMVKRVVELHGGRIWVESKGMGQGCCFRFTLPTAVH